MRNACSARHSNATLEAAPAGMVDAIWGTLDPHEGKHHQAPGIRGKRSGCERAATRRARVGAGDRADGRQGCHRCLTVSTARVAQSGSRAGASTARGLDKHALRTKAWRVGDERARKGGRADGEPGGG